MSSVKLSSIKPGCSPPSVRLFPIPELRRNSVPVTNSSALNSYIEKIPFKNAEKQLTFEVKTNTFNRKIEVKTKQEDTICTTKQFSPTITCSTTNPNSSPKCVRISQSPKSSISNSSIQSVRVSVSSSPYQNEISHKSEPQSPTYSSMISNFIRENLNEQTNYDKQEAEEEKIFDRRPLLELINELNQHKKLSDLETNVKTRETISPSPSRILPAKQISPFRPVILHKKYQEPIGRFDLIANNENSSLNHRNGVIRSETFPSSPLINSHSNEISSNNPPPLSNDSSLIKSEQTSSSLSISGISLTSTSTANATPTSSTNTDDKNEAKRKAIAMQMYETEKSYVEALKNLVTKYYLPMKDKDVVSNDLINDIFYKIPEIHIHHTAFLISLSQKLSQWDNKQTVGDLLLQMFTRTSVIETYTSFVNNYKTAQIAIRLCRDFSSFNKFLEQQARDHRGKLTLRDLIIQPVQRIPRYELYIKDFLKCTNLNHPDYQLLFKAQSEIHSLAEQIDRVQKEVGSTELTVTSNSLEGIQDIIENLTDLVNPNRYYIRHDVVTLQSSSGLKKDRCIFLFNDLIIITSCKRRTGTLTKKTNNSVIVNSPSGKQYIDNAKHKLIMKISLESVDLPTDHLKKTRLSITTPPSLKKSPSIVSNITDKHRHLEDDLLTLGQMSDLAKTITTPHQQLDESIKETVNSVNKYLLDETTSLTNHRRISPEPNLISVEQKSNYIQLIIHTTERIETIDVLFSSLEIKTTWEKNFLEAKKILFEMSAGGRNITFEHVLTLPHNRPGSEFTCGTISSYSNDVYLCNTEGEIYLINAESDIRLKSSNTITSSKINCIEYIPSNENEKKCHPKKAHHHHHQHKHHLITKEQTKNIDSLLDIDSSDDDEQENISLSHFSMTSWDNYLHNEEEDTIWLGTQNGELFIYELSQIMKISERKSRIMKQFNSSIHSILYTDKKVFLALNHRQLCVFKRDINGRWDLDCPIIQSIEDTSTKSADKIDELDNEENSNPISVMSLVAGKLWCGISDRIFVVCPNSFNVQHSFIVDDYHRHICSIATGGTSIHHVWIASQDSHEIRLYHATHFLCLLEISIRTPVIQKLQVCDDIIRAHKLGCLRVSTLHACKETLWIGTSAGVLLNLTISQLIDSLSTNKLSPNSIQLECLSFGHAGPVRFILSKTEEGTTNPNTFVISIGDGFEDFNNNNDENLGKTDALAHMIFWKLGF